MLLCCVFKACLVGIVVTDPDFLPIWAKKKGLEGSYLELSGSKVRFLPWDVQTYSAPLSLCVPDNVVTVYRRWRTPFSRTSWSWAKKQDSSLLNRWLLPCSTYIGFLPVCCTSLHANSIFNTLGPLLFSKNRWTIDQSLFCQTELPLTFYSI